MTETEAINLDTDTVSDDDLAAVPRLADEGPAMYVPPKAKPWRALPFADYATLPAHGSTEALDAARQSVADAAEACQVALDRVGSLADEQAEHEAGVLAAAIAAKVPKLTTSPVDWSLERRVRQRQFSDARDALVAARKAFDDLWAQERPSVTRDAVQAVPEAIQAARQAFQAASSEVRRALADVATAATLAAGDDEVRAQYGKELGTDLAKIRRALDVVEQTLAGGLGDYLNQDTLVFPTLRQREHLATSEAGSYQLAQVETREDFQVTAFTREFASQLLAGNGVTDQGIFIDPRRG